MSKPGAPSLHVQKLTKKEWDDRIPKMYSLIVTAYMGLSCVRTIDGQYVDGVISDMRQKLITEGLGTPAQNTEEWLKKIFDVSEEAIEMLIKLGPLSKASIGSMFFGLLRFPVYEPFTNLDVVRQAYYQLMSQKP